MKQKILIADDDPDVRKLLARALSAEPYELVSVGNGKDARDLASTENPGVIVLDINMPQKNGLDVLRELRRNVSTRMIPVILLTARTSVSDEVSGLDMGADDYITKPFDLDELRARIAGVLRRNQLALSANPLTRLPGSPMIEEEINRRIREKIPFAFLYIDINHFKSYNDAYGFARGDQVIRQTAEVLTDFVGSCAGEGGFLGHIGGDDFIVVCAPREAPHLAQRIVSKFDERAPDFYEIRDRVLGYIQTKNRQSQWQKFPFISLSIGIATTKNRKLNHYAKVVQIASEMKNHCKASAVELSRIAFDRRSDVQQGGLTAAAGARRRGLFLDSGPRWDL